MSVTGTKAEDAEAPPLRRWFFELPYLGQVIASPLRRVKTGTLAHAESRNPTIVFPGILSGDASTSLLRRTLAASGYSTYSSTLGFVKGITHESLARAQERLAEVAEAYDEKVILIGWSLGGFYARILAQRFPALVEMVITLGTPFSGDRHANNAWWLYNLLNDHTVDEPSLSDDPAWKPPVPTLAVWSPKDGVVSPASSRGMPHERDEAIEVPYRHFAMGSDRRAIADIVGLLDARLSS